jgi:hypothetical protein
MIVIVRPYHPAPGDRDHQCQDTGTEVLAAPSLDRYRETG